MDILFHMKWKLHPAKRKILPLPISLEFRSLWWLKRIRTLVKATIMQNHLGLNNMLLNYCKWRQIIHCKRFHSHQWAQITLISNKIYIIGFPKRNFLINEKYISKKELYMHWKPVVSLNFTPPWYVSCKTDML